MPLPASGPANGAPAALTADARTAVAAPLGPPSAGSAEGYPSTGFVGPVMPSLPPDAAGVSGRAPAAPYGPNGAVPDPSARRTPYDTTRPGLY